MQPTTFVAIVRAYDDADRQIHPERVYLKLLNISVDGMAATETYLNHVLEQLVVEDGARPRPDRYHLTVHDAYTGDLRLNWRYTPRIEAP